MNEQKENELAQRRLRSAIANDSGEMLANLQAEIARLRLTDEEREAVEYYVGTGGPDSVDATLRKLLERLK